MLFQNGPDRIKLSFYSEYLYGKIANADKAKFRKERQINKHSKHIFTNKSNNANFSNRDFYVIAFASIANETFFQDILGYLYCCQRLMYYGLKLRQHINVFLYIHYPQNDLVINLNELWNKVKLQGRYF